MNALIKSWAKLSFLFGIVGFELLLLPTMNLSLINDAHSIVFLSLYTISIILNFVTYHDSFVNQPIAMILSISFMCSTGLYMFVIFSIEINISFRAKPYQFIYLLCSCCLAIFSGVFKIFQFIH